MSEPPRDQERERNGPGPGTGSTRGQGAHAPRLRTRGPAPQAGVAELRAARIESRGLYWLAALFSIFSNLLVLTGPLYMLLVYDRVLSSRSVETLIALTLLVAFLFAMMGLLDGARARLLSRIGARFQERLDRRVYEAALRQSSDAKPGGETALQDLEAIRAVLGSAVPGALADLPWVPVFLAGLALFHPALGLLALSGGAALVALAAIGQALGRGRLAQGYASAFAARQQADQIRAEAGVVRAMGMGPATFRRWQHARRDALEALTGATDATSALTALSRALRLFLQSAMLGLGAWLVLHEALSPGAMIAGSVLMGRALAPVELLIGNWPLLSRARRGWQALARLLEAQPELPRRTTLPRPAAKLEVQQASVVPPGESLAALRMVTFSLAPGQACGVIGPSGAGKSTLARTLTNAWPCAGGAIRLDGATLDQYDPEELGRLIGYLPQRVELFEGTIAENIARLAERPDDAQVVAAARRADAHEMILKMPAGYDTRVSPHGGRLSGGQIQRIGLARALYGDPVLLVLDEPNSNLDNEGSRALNAAIRALREAGASVLIMAHRPAAIQECDLLLMLDHGQRVAFGPRDEVLRRVVQNHDQIRSANAGAGGIR
ncbi:type I secretion system ABC transporter, PrtD family [Pseudooceanicola antarcticus]|uniref:Type I secretion system ABC transporter, PrtD family n=1 Tax=Pseudooceanicola antarcticus TaxID=1247613 RepID=A0A285HIX7_9RHOB|nr:type I secretion system ABC transporter, PrtD family [Pseudooceanicola antarcticus]